MSVSPQTLAGCSLANVERAEPELGYRVQSSNGVYRIQHKLDDDVDFVNCRADNPDGEAAAHDTRFE
jgi:hypothetical protein